MILSLELSRSSSDRIISEQPALKSSHITHANTSGDVEDHRHGRTPASCVCAVYLDRRTCFPRYLTYCLESVGWMLPLHYG